MPFSAARSLGNFNSAVDDAVSLMSRDGKQIDWLKNLRELCRRESGAASVLCENFHKVGDLVKIVRCFQKK
jgi:hypothetical protein